MNLRDPSYDDQVTPLLDPAVGVIIHRIKAALREVFPQTIWEWERLFQNADDPKRAILEWLRIAQLYRASRPAPTRGNPSLTALQRDAVFDAILSCYELGPEPALDDKDTAADCRPAAERAVQVFKAGPSEGEKEELAQVSVVLDGNLAEIAG